jgi:hypothetical protein
MLRIILFSLFFCFNSSTIANCHYDIYFLHKEISNQQVKDKTKHCTLSCQLGIRCNSNTTLILGALKELKDLLGPGNFEFKDMYANYVGVSYSSILKKNVRSSYVMDEYCFDYCLDQFEF